MPKRDGCSSGNAGDLLHGGVAAKRCLEEALPSSVSVQQQSFLSPFNQSLRSLRLRHFHLHVTLGTSAVVKELVLDLSDSLR